MLSLMRPQLQLMGFLESFHGEQGLVLQIQWEEMRFPPVGVVEDVSLYSSLQQIRYNSLSCLELDISRSFSAAEFSAQCSLYLAPKIASFASDMASSLGGTSLPSLFIFAELKTINIYSDPTLRRRFDAATQPLIPRRQDPFRQPGGSLLGSRLFSHDFLVSELRYSSEPNVLAMEGEDCSVCLEEMSAIEELLTTRCDHIFHEQCILSWWEKKNSCPLCRSQLQD